MVEVMDVVVLLIVVKLCVALLVVDVVEIMDVVPVFMILVVVMGETILLSSSEHLQIGTLFCLTHSPKG